MDKLLVVCLALLPLTCAGFKLADNYDSHPDKDCAGNDFLGGFSFESINECQATCDQHDECVAFVYKDTVSEHSCWPKNLCDYLTQNYDGWTTYIKTSGSSEGEQSGDNGDDEDDSESEEDNDYIRAGGCKFSLDPRHALYGYNDQYLEGLSEDQCLETCANTEACLSIDRNIASGNCIISYSSKNTNPEAFGRHGRVNYYQKVSCQEEEETADDEEIIGGQCIKTYGPYGGDGGQSFSDRDLFVQNLGKISKIEINHGLYIDCISVTYGRKDEAQKGPCHGSRGGTTDVIKLKKREYITGIQGMAGDLIDQLTFTTNRQTYGPYGTEGGNAFFLDPNSRQLAFISGKAGNSLDQLSFHFYC